MSSIAILGAGHAGVQAAASLRQAGFSQQICLIDSAKDLPYHRPPLSKTFLSGEKTEQQLLLRGKDFYDQNDIKLMRNTRVLHINVEQNYIQLADEKLQYDQLVFAMGSEPRRLSGFDQKNVLVLRDLPDAVKLKKLLESNRRITMIGGGFIGLEVAATARKLGLSVDIIEAQGRLLKRAMPEFLSVFIKQQHEKAGSNIHLNTTIQNVEENHGTISKLVLSNGKSIETDLVLLCVGNAPRVELAEQAGTKLEAGAILVDSQMRTSLPDIYAIGDCTSFHMNGAAQVTRLESVQNAVDQAKILASLLTGKDEKYNPVPWFWSDQFDLKIQMAGLSVPNTEFHLRGSPTEKRFSLLETLNGKLIAAYSVNSPADHMATRKLIAQNITLDINVAINPDIPLRNSLAATSI